MKNSNWMRLLAVVVIITALVAACGPLQQVPTDNSGKKVEALGTSQTIRTLTIGGNGMVTLVPDIARINVGVNSKAKEVSEAVNLNNKQALAITEALKKKGVEEKDIQTANFNVYPMQQYDHMTNEVIGVTYNVDNTLYVTVHDLKSLSEILDAAIKAGANQINGISFDIDNRQAAQEQARDLALKDAEAKAKSVAETMGVSIDQVVTINVTNSSYVQPYPMYGMGGGEAKQAMDTSVPISAGQIVVTYEVTLTYSIK